MTMWFVVKDFCGKPHISKTPSNPRDSMSWKVDAQTILCCVKLTEVGNELSLNTLRALFLAGTFNKSVSDFHSG